VLDGGRDGPLDSSTKRGPDARGQAPHRKPVFLNDPLLVIEDVRHSSYENRSYALGRTDSGRLLHISFTLRGGGKLIRVISARAMHRKERLRYEQTA
jgi:uncharacterized DUF497 family protein